MRTDEELKTIARDLFTGKIFCDRHLREGENLEMVFSILLFMNKEQHEKFQAEEPYFIYEYLNQAGPRSCNGLPMFFSMQFLKKADSDKMFDYYNKYKELEKQI